MLACSTDPRMVDRPPSAFLTVLLLALLLLTIARRILAVGVGSFYRRWEAAEQQTSRVAEEEEVPSSTAGALPIDEGTERCGGMERVRWHC